MFGLEKIADAFDRIHADVQRDFDNLMLERGGRWAGDNLGPDSGWTYALAVPVGIGWSLGTFTLASGKALVDVLRLGDGVKSGTLSGVGQDGLRVLNLIPVVSAGERRLAWPAPLDEPRRSPGRWVWWANRARDLADRQRSGPLPACPAAT